MTALIIANTQIRCDAAGRYCLNDLHQASGGASRHQPANWLRLQQTQELVAECAKSDEAFLTSEEREVVVTLQGGFVQGTYAVKELVYAYAMWISAAFHLHVIRAYDALVQQRTAPRPGLAAQPQHRADQLVSAGRVFAAAFRTARSARVPYPQALQAATDCAQRHTGIDWQEELGAHVQLTAPTPSHIEMRADSVGQFHAALIAGAIDGLIPCNGLSTDWYAAYVRWCADVGTWSLPMPKFVHAMERQYRVPTRRGRWGTGQRVADLPINSFLMLGDPARTSGALPPAWLGEQRAACKAMVDRYLASPLRAGTLGA